MGYVRFNNITLSHSIRETLPLIEFLDEVHSAIRIKPFLDAKVTKYTVFKDNNGCIEWEKCSWLRLRMKHIAKYYHFRSKVTDYLIKVLPIDTKDQIVDIFMKALPKE